MRGDIILSIHNEDATYLFHQEANDIIRTSGGSLQLGIKRYILFYIYITVVLIWDLFNMYVIRIPDSMASPSSLYQPFQSYATQGFKAATKPVSVSTYSVYDEDNSAVNANTFDSGILVILWYFCGDLGL